MREAGGGTGRRRPVIRRAVRGSGVLAVAALLGAIATVPAAAEPGTPAARTVPGLTPRATYGPGGARLDAPSRDADVSEDGRYVLFSSEADDLLPGDTNGIEDAFVRDT